MSMLTPDLSASPLSGIEMNALEFSLSPQGGSGGPQFGDVLASLQTTSAAPVPLDGQALAATGLPAGRLDWAPALTVQPLGQHLQLITPGTSDKTEGSLEDFARAQGLDEATIGWLMGQATEAANATGLAANPVASPGSSPIASLLPETGTGLSAGLAPIKTLAGPLQVGNFTAAGTGTRDALAQHAGTLLQSGQNPDADGAEAGPTGAVSAGGGTGQGGGILPAGSSGSSTTNAHGAAQATLAALGVAAGTPWADLARQGASTARASGDGALQRAEPTESLMATLRSPAATALAGLQRQLQAAGTPTPAAAAAKTAASLRVSDLDLSQSLSSPGVEAGPDLEHLLTEWSARLDSPAAADAGHAPALAAVRGHGAMASSPLGLVPPGSEPQLGIDLADKFEQLAEKMGQAVAQRMLSEIEKGHWHLKLMLRPATLGHIEVEMRMRSGELDASFVVSQNLTRELLQESLPRLRETLTQLGMDVANMNVDSGRSQQGDGEPTPRAQAMQDRGQSPDGPAEPTVITPGHQARHGQEGWDVMV